MFYSLNLTLSDPGYLRKLTIWGVGALKAHPPPTISKTSCENNTFVAIMSEMDFKYTKRRRTLMQI